MKMGLRHVILGGIALALILTVGPAGAHGGVGAEAVVTVDIGVAAPTDPTHYPVEVRILSATASSPDGPYLYPAAGANPIFANGPGQYARFFGVAGGKGYKVALKCNGADTWEWGVQLQAPFTPPGAMGLGNSGIYVREFKCVHQPARSADARPSTLSRAADRVLWSDERTTIMIYVNAPADCYGIEVHVLSASATDPAGNYIKGGWVYSSADPYICNLSATGYRIAVKCQGQDWRWAVQQQFPFTPPGAMTVPSAGVYSRYFNCPDL